MKRKKETLAQRATRYSERDFGARWKTPRMVVADAYRAGYAARKREERSTNQKEK